MSSISINEELAFASTIDTEETVLAKSVSADNPLTSTTGLSEEDIPNDMAKTRFYLAAMSHFFSNFSGER
jgi:hypothetical protein